MKKIYLFVFCTLTLKSAFCQTIDTDTLQTKRYCYFDIYNDRLKSGLTGTDYISKIDFSDSAINRNEKYKALSPVGLPPELSFFKITLNFPKSIFSRSYIYCHNSSNGKNYKLKGFYENDFFGFFEYLRKNNYKINTHFFKNKFVAVEGLDFDCLIGVYKDFIKSSDSEVSLQKKNTTACLDFMK